jgi:multidrug efflux pump subunit AcrB
MWLVRTALRHPYTFVVMALVIALGGTFAVRRMSTDLLPEIDIPVVVVVWSYGGLTPDEMEKRVVSNYERFLTTTVSDVEHVESQTLSGVSVIKVFFHPGTRIDAAIAQVTATSQTAVRSLPPGATPPLILRYNAANAPVLQLVLASDSLSEQQIFDLGVNVVRAGLATVQGAGVPYPYGGRFRQVMVDLDLDRLHAFGLSPRDVMQALNAQNLVLPTGTIKMGTREYPVLINSSPDSMEALNAVPLRSDGPRTVYVRDVAHVRDGFAPQTNIVHRNGRRAVVMPILKSAGASTVDVVSRVLAMLPKVKAGLPPELEVVPIFDQSVFVRAAIESVLHEGALAAGLTGLLMLVFLGSVRSTLVVVVSIPLSLAVSATLLAVLGHSLNSMTLGGMALAVGILVDDATVELENIHRQLGLGKTLVRAILDGAEEVAGPAFVSTLAICIVFLPVGFIAGPARSLFVPLALAVVFAMLTSYFLSRTLVPTLVATLLGPELARVPQPSLLGRLRAHFEHGFEALGARYERALVAALQRARAVAAGFAAFVLLSCALFLGVGRDFFPSVDAGLIRLHARLPAGTRIEESERVFVALGRAVRELLPQGEVGDVLDNVGVTGSPINLSMGDGSMISSADGELLVSLRPGHAPTADHVRTLRRELRRRFPELTLFFLAPDLASQVLNFGISAPIDVRFTATPPTADKVSALARAALPEIQRIPGIVDAHLHQVLSAPMVRVDVARDAASQLGLTQRDVASDLLVSLSSSAQAAPGFWLDPRRGVQYPVAVQTPQPRMAGLGALASTPVGNGGGHPLWLGNVASFSRARAATNITHLNAMPTFDVLANVEGTDLGSVAAQLERVVARWTPELPKGVTLSVSGQVEAMGDSFRGLTLGVGVAVLLVYLLLVVNFQSFRDPWIILSALPGAGAGIAWMLHVTQTTLSVPALMGSIMCVGVATANSVLVVSFANEARRAEPHLSAREAARRAGVTRLRPVCMTALAMLLGMLPMALGLGAGAEQNAPLARAVIGGLSCATLSTLLVVPVIYSLLRRTPPGARTWSEGP